MTAYQKGVRQMSCGNYFDAAKNFMSEMKSSPLYSVRIASREKFLSCVALDVELKA